MMNDHNTSMKPWINKD